jgi:hypothetical protein
MVVKVGSRDPRARADVEVDTALVLPHPYAPTLDKCGEEEGIQHVR